MCLLETKQVIDRILQEGFILTEVIDDRDYYFERGKLLFKVRVHEPVPKAPERFFALYGDHTDRFVSWEDAFYEGYATTLDQLNRELEKFNYLDGWSSPDISEYVEADELGLWLDSFEGWLFYNVIEEAERHYYGR